MQLKQMLEISILLIAILIDFFVYSYWYFTTNIMLLYDGEEIEFDGLGGKDLPREKSFFH